MTSPLQGTIGMFGFNFAPRDWAFCQGQALAIAQNTALYSLLGTQYGGNGTTTFNLPDLRGRVPVGQGQGPTTPLRTMGEVFGADQVTLTANQMPMHNHTVTLNSVGAKANKEGSNGHNLANAQTPTGSGVDIYSDGTPDTTLASSAVTVANAGGSQPFYVDQPSLVLNYCIAMVGIYPSRN